MRGAIEHAKSIYWVILREFQGQHFNKGRGIVALKGASQGQKMSFYMYFKLWLMWRMLYVEINVYIENLRWRDYAWKVHTSSFECHINRMDSVSH